MPEDHPQTLSADDLESRIEGLVGEIDTECERVEVNAGVVPAAAETEVSEAELAVLQGEALGDEGEATVSAQAPDEPEPEEPEPTEEPRDSGPAALEDAMEPGLATADAEPIDPLAGLDDAPMDANDHMDADSLAAQVADMLDAAVTKAEQQTEPEPMPETEAEATDDAPPVVEDFGPELETSAAPPVEPPPPTQTDEPVALHAEPQPAPQPQPTAGDESLADLTAQLLEHGLDADLHEPIETPDAIEPAAVEPVEAEPEGEHDSLDDTLDEALAAAVAEELAQPEAQPVVDAAEPATADETEAALEPAPTPPPSVKSEKQTSDGTARKAANTVWVHVKRGAQTAGAAAAPVGAKAALVASQPLEKHPDRLRHTIGWLAMYTAFLAGCVWVYLAFFRQPNTPEQTSTPSALVEAGGTAAAVVQEN